MKPKVFVAMVSLLVCILLSSCAAMPPLAMATDTPSPSATPSDAPRRTPHPSLGEVDLQPGHTAFSHRARSGEWVDYLLYLPDDYDPEITWPFIVFLHGGVGVRKNIMVIFDDSLPELADPEMDLPFVVVSPLLPEGFWPSYLDRVEELVEHLLEELPVDERRIYLTGFSSGSYGAWRYAMSYPDRFTAVAPVSAGPSLLPTEPVPEGICRLRGLPIHAFHSKGDTGVPVEMTRAAVEALQDCGADIRYTEFSEPDHLETMDAVYGSPELYDWFLTQVR